MHEQRLARFRGRELVGFKTGIKSLDSRTLGIRGLGALGAGAGVGKTALALNIAIGVCRHHAVNDAVVVFVSLEMPRYELYSRVKCNLAGSGVEHAGAGLGGPAGRQASTSTERTKRKLQRAKQRMQDEQIGSRLTILDREQLGESLTADRLAMITARAKDKGRGIPGADGRRLRADPARAAGSQQVHGPGAGPVSRPRLAGCHPQIEIGRQSGRRCGAVYLGNQQAGKVARIRGPTDWRS